MIPILLWLTLMLQLSASTDSRHERNVITSFVADLDVYPSPKKYIDFKKARTELCSHFYLHVEDIWELDLRYESSCEISGISNYGPYGNINVKLMIPHYLLITYKIYNNDADFDLTMKRVWERSLTSGEYWKLYAVNILHLKIGEVLSVGLLKGTSSCSVHQDLCMKPISQAEPSSMATFRSSLCYQLIKRINTGDHKNIVEHCWAAIKGHDDKNVLVNAYLFYPWDAAYKYKQHSTNFAFLRDIRYILSQFEAHSTRKLLNVTSVSSEFVDDVITIPFKGCLLVLSKSDEWDIRFRLTDTDLYKETVEGISDQLVKQIFVGNNELVPLIPMINVVKIEEVNVKWSQLIGNMEVSKSGSTRLGIPNKQLPQALQKAYEKGKDVIRSRYITNVSFGEFDKGKENTCNSQASKIVE